MNPFFTTRNAAIIGMIFGIAYSFSPWGNAGVSLLSGLLVASFLGNPFIDTTKTLTSKLLAYAIVGLGAGMNLMAVSKAGLSGLGITALSITATLAAGIAIGRLVRADRETSLLIAVGTAICGGSAIAAIAPIIRAKSHSITVALGTVFLLNAAALLLFPVIGHYFDLGQEQFGFWSALAIHDTSSVVGAGLQYGPGALHTGVTVKLARALWIVPLTIGFGFFYRDEAAGHGGKAKKPWFILGFLLMAAFFTWLPQFHDLGSVIEGIARKCLVATLFLIGANLNAATLREVGWRPILQGMILWILVSVISLTAVTHWGNR